MANKRHRDREGDRRYLLAGLVKCEVCGYACIGHSANVKGVKYHYYRATCGRTGEGVRKGIATALPHRAPFLNASWLENVVWEDVRGFLENPGETLERLRAQLVQNKDTEDLERRRRDLVTRLTARQGEKDKFVKLYAAGHLDEEELETRLLDLKNQIENLRMLIGSVEADLSGRRERVEIAETTHAWLLTLRERLSEVEKDTEEAFRARRKLVRLLVAEVIAGEKRRDGTSEVRITYRFDPDGETLFVSGVPNATYLSKAKQATAPAV